MKSIRSRLGFLFILFTLLITVSVGVTFWGLQAQAEDALAINLAGRQRMLVQQMTRLAVENRSGEETGSALAEAGKAFEETLQALISGGEVEYPSGRQVALKPVREPEIREQLAGVELTWKAYQSEMELLLASPTAGAEADTELSALKQLSAELVTQADRTVRSLQDSSRAQSRHLRAVQAGFFAAALVLLGMGSLLVRQELLQPLKRLGQSTERIRSGDLSTPVESGGPTEILLLTHAFESMRAELEHSQQELSGWTQTLEERVKRRTQELEALHSVSREISARLERREVLHSVTAKANELLQAEVAFLCLLDPAKTTLGLQAISGPEETVKKLSSPADNPFVRSILNPACGQLCKAEGCPGTCGIMDERYKASHLAAPLVVENRVIGALCVGNQREGAFSDDASSLLTRLASAAAVAIENARLYERAEHLAALEERQRIAGAMHDGLAQMVDALGLLLDQAGDQLEAGTLEGARKILERARKNQMEAASEVRRSIARLQEEPPRPKALQEQLQNLVCQHSREDGPHLDWQADLARDLFLPGEDIRQVLGIAQEALANARRHSRASRVSMRLAQCGGDTILTIEDDGQGFDPGALRTDERQHMGSQHFGLKILTARAAQLGGRLAVDSAPGKGTRISLIWPVRKPDFPVAPGQKEL